MMFHPASLLFPQMDQHRLDELKASIKQDGQLLPATLFEGQILDGRHRWLACEALGIECKTIEHVGNPWRYVIAMNAQRRDLPAEVRALSTKRAIEAGDRWEEKNRARKEEANEKRAESISRQPRDEKGRVKHQDDVRPVKAVANREKSAEIAKAANVSTAAVDRMAELDRKRPDLADKVIAGEMKPTEARRQMKREEVAERVAELPPGKYRVIYADPPWQYNDARALDDYESTAAENNYPTMSLTELCVLGVKDLAADDAVLFCWATFPLLPDALVAVKSWGFRYKTAIVWDKQRTNVGNYHDARAELLLICTRGSCTPDGKKPPQVISEARGRHSEKPESFRKIIDEMYQHGPRIELFRRGEAPSGWEIWGNEAA